MTNYKNIWLLPAYPRLLLKILLFFFHKNDNNFWIRMSGNNVNFGDKKIKKINFYKNKKVIKIDDTDVSKILVSKEEPYGSKNSFKYFIGYNGNHVIRPLYIKLPQIIGYIKNFESNMTMSFKISDKQLLKKYKQIWKKVKKW